MAISNIDLSSYVGKTTGSPISADDWNNLFTSISNKFKEIVTLVNTNTNSITSGGSSSGSGSSSDGSTSITYNSNRFFINGKQIEPTNGVITLSPGGKYELTGTLLGNIIIDGSSAEDTYITLNGVDIINTTLCESVIKNYVDKTTLFITLAKNTVNYLGQFNVVDRIASESQDGCIHSEHDLVIQGSGYLAIKQLGGHGAKASLLKCTGNPHIYIECNHDGLHATSKLAIDSGVYYVKGAVDAFAAAGSGDGQIFLFGGEYYAYDIQEDVFDSKGQGYWFTEESPVVHNNFDTTSSHEIFHGIITYKDETTTYFPDGAIYNVTASSTASVGAITVGSKYLTLTTTISPNNEGCYDLPNGDSQNGGTKVYYITGKIDKPINIPFIDAIKGPRNVGVDIYLDKAYICTSTDCPSITYQSKKSKMKMFGIKGTVNMIKQYSTTRIPNTTEISYDYDAIKSESNLSFEMKNDSYLLVNSNLEDGIDSSKITLTDMSGTIISNNNGCRGMKGNVMYFGSTEDDYLTTTTPYTTFDGSLICLNNCLNNNGIALNYDSSNANSGIADIYARNGSSYSEGILYIDDNRMNGIIVCNSLAAVVKFDTNKTNKLYYKEIVTGKMTTWCEPTLEDFEYIPYGKGKFGISK